MRVEGKLTNQEGEFIASGPCEINRDRGEITMWPSWEMHMLERERGALKLTLENGMSYDISDKHLTFKLQGAAPQRISVYRLRITEQIPAHLAAGYVAPSLAPEDDPAYDAEREDTPAEGAPALRVIRSDAP